MADPATVERRLVLSMSPASTGERRFAGAVVILSLAVFAAAAPFARVKLPPVAAFIPCYESALVINDLITAALLFGQSVLARSRALLLLASGYLFTAAMTVVHALTFPGLFAEGGLLGAGPQSTAWLYMFWHAGFPALVIGYTLLRMEGGGRWRASPGVTILCSAAMVLSASAALTALATVGAAALPAIMSGNGYTAALPYVVAVIWSVNLLALVLLLRRRPLSLLDLWLAVVLCAWLFDVALSAGLNAQRFDLGFYAGRAYGLAASGFVLAVLLVETILLYARAARELGAEGEERERRLDEMRSELIHVSRLAELGQMVSALAHEVSQPLTALGNYLRAGERLIEIGDAIKARTALAKAAKEATRAGDILNRLRAFIKKSENLARSEPLRSTVEETVAIALPGVDRREVTVELRLDPAAPMVFIDKVQIQQVLLNLIRNAVEAMAEGPRHSLVIASAAAASGMVEVSVADTGPGLAPEVRQKLFSPFVTTKSAGMGIGLSICRSIIETHDGRLWAEDNPGGGTVFRFTLKQAEAGVRSDAAA